MVARAACRSTVTGVVSPITAQDRGPDQYPDMHRTPARVTKLIAGLVWGWDLGFGGQRFVRFAVFPEYFACVLWIDAAVEGFRC